MTKNRKIPAVTLSALMAVLMASATEQLTVKAVNNE